MWYYGANSGRMVVCFRASQSAGVKDSQGGAGRVVGYQIRRGMGFLQGRFTSSDGGFIMKRSVSLVTLLAIVALAVPSSGTDWASINYVGFGWEDGGFPPSNEGDVFYFVGSATAADPIFEVDLEVDELTFYLYDLISWGMVEEVGYSWVTYHGGHLDVWRDPQRNAQYGTDPPNSTVPSTFTDGTLYFRGPFINFTIYLYPNGTGEYYGELNGEEGEVIGDIVCYGCVVTFAGLFTQESGAQIPDGYDMQVTGTLLVDEAVSTEQTSLSKVKALFN